MAFVDLIGLLTTPVPARGLESRRGGRRFNYDLATGDPFQPLPSATSPSSRTFQEAAENLFASHYVAYAAVGAYADAVASLPLKVYEKDPSSNDREVVTGGDLVQLLAKPNPHQDYYEFMHALVVSLFLGGEAPVEKVRNLAGTRTVQMLIMRPDHFGPIVNEVQGLVGYQYEVGARAFGYDPDEIMFFKLTNPTNEWRGLSPITAARLSIETDLAAARYNRNFLSNGSIPGGALVTDQDLLPRERKEIRGEWEAVHRDVTRAGRVAVLDKGLRFDGSSLSQRDAQWLEGRQHEQEAVLVVYRLPAAILGIERTVNRSTADVMYRSWYKGPVRSLARRLEAKLTYELAHEFNPNYFVEFLMDDVLRPDMEERAEAGSKAWWITPNEKRKWENLPALEGGDEMWVPVNMAQGGNPVNEVAPRPVAPGLLPPDGEEPAEVVKRVVRPFGR